MSSSLEDELNIECSAAVKAFHAQFLAWRQKNGLPLPRDLVKEGDSFSEDWRQFDLLLKQYCDDGGVHYRELTKGPRTTAVLEDVGVKDTQGCLLPLTL